MTSVRTDKAIDAATASKFNSDNHTDLNRWPAPANFSQIAVQTVDVSQQVCPIEFYEEIITWIVAADVHQLRRTRF